VRSDPVLRKYYRIINKKFFNEELPNNVCVRYVTDEDTDEEAECERKYYGWTSTGLEKRHKYIIVISRVKNPGWPAKLSTLAHEMVHCATGLRDGHGKAFSDWHEILTSRGLFRKGAILRGLTIF
jgi:hypothetical protein